MLKFEIHHKNANMKHMYHVTIQVNFGEINNVLIQFLWSKQGKLGHLKSSFFVSEL